MPICPRGHESDLDDYCDVCGAAISGLSAPGPARPGVDPPQRARTGAVPPRTGPSVCPDCENPMNGRFCERCGFDALAVPAPPVATDPTDPISPNAPRTTSPSAPGPTSPSVPGPISPSGSTGPAGSAPEAPPPVSAPGGPPPLGDDAARPQDRVPAAGWHAVVSADRAHFDRIRTEHGTDPEINFPWFCPDRRFSLASAQVVIGRHSRSRGIYPDIDLTGPPEDSAVSHLHALLVAQPDGWAVVDLRSANRTYVNDQVEPIPPEKPVVLRDGDHIHVGAWTRITLRAGPLP
ncbi:FHA domain-containing protein [Micromonospora sp. NPDC050397]|uniref:FHA domain-containing protein n=1 Tax=Micromonospora sp. NPDC050397 TaxID=3364279 RepID=UPI00384B6EA5